MSDTETRSARDGVSLLEKRVEERLRNVWRKADAVATQRSAVSSVIRESSGFGRNTDCLLRRTLAVCINLAVSQSVPESGLLVQPDSQQEGVGIAKMGIFFPSSSRLSIGRHSSGVEYSSHAALALAIFGSSLHCRRVKVDAAAAAALS